MISILDDPYFKEKHQFYGCNKFYTYAELEYSSMKNGEELDEWYDPMMCKGCNGKDCNHVGHSGYIDQEHISEDNWKKIKRYYKAVEKQKGNQSLLKFMGVKQ